MLIQTGQQLSTLWVSPPVHILYGSCSQYHNAYIQAMNSPLDRHRTSFISSFPCSTRMHAQIFFFVLSLRSGKSTRAREASTGVMLFPPLPAHRPIRHDTSPSPPPPSSDIYCYYYHFLCIYYYTHCHPMFLRYQAMLPCDSPSPSPSPSRVKSTYVHILRTYVYEYTHYSALAWMLT